mgnify:CR=1 FL=1
MPDGKSSEDSPRFNTKVGKATAMVVNVYILPGTKVAIVSAPFRLAHLCTHIGCLGV